MAANGSLSIGREQRRSQICDVVAHDDHNGIVNVAFSGTLDNINFVSDEKTTNTTINIEHPSKLTGLKLTWTDLTYDVTARQFETSYPFMSSKTKRILQPQSGQLASGQLVALMGPSGAGKSTLLNCLTARNLSGVGGTITVSGAKGQIVSVAVVPQQDALFPQFTVRESLMFASRVKNPTWTLKQHSAACDRVISDLNLEVCVDNQVARCSGGQIRRVSIGVELVSRPDILVLDEPTSGLDSSNAELCIQLLRDLAQRPDGPAVLATIHQPSADILEMFTMVYLMSRYGCCVYFDSPLNITENLANYDLEVPEYCNPADFALEVANAKFGDDKLDLMTKQQKTATELSIAGSGLDNRKSLRSVVNKMRNRPLPWFYHLWLLSWRSFQVSCIKSSHLLFRIGINAAVGLLLAFLWSDPIGKEDGCWAPNSLTNLTGADLLKDQLLSPKPPAIAKQEYLDKVNTTNSNAIFLFSTVFFTTVVYLMSTVLSFPLEVATVKRELSNSWYKASSYFVAKTIADVPPLMLSVLFLVMVSYPISEQIGDFWRFAAVYGNLVLLAEICESIGMFFGVLLAHDMVIATLVTMASFFPVLMFGGFLVKQSSVPWYFEPLTYMSYARYAYENILVTIYGYDRCESGAAVSNFIEDLLKAENPRSVLTTVWDSLEINYRDAPKFAEVLKVPVDHMAAVLNATSDWLGTSYQPIDLDTDYLEPASIGDAISESNDSEEQLSYVLYFFEVDDSVVDENIIILCGIIVLIRVLTFLVLRLKTRTGT
ncbi:ATP-binding cassette sub-family G member 1 [Halotydeus destructor]|nr:ATP-binding cassette sub-family G member 1 [Halotydeus destructor]